MTKVIIIGGGVIGLSTSLYLAKAGYDIIILEKYKPGSQASKKNAGLIVPSMYIPYPISIDYIKLLKWIFSPSSPIKIAPTKLGYKTIKSILMSRKYLIENQEWRILRRLGREAINSIKNLINFIDMDIEASTGKILEVYINEEAFREAEEYAVELKNDGIDTDILSGSELREIEPRLSKHIIGGLRYKIDMSINPVKYIDGLTELAKTYEVKIIERTSAQKIIVKNKYPVVYTEKGERFSGEYVVVAAGPWTSSLLNPLGIDLPVYPAKGYIMELSNFNGNNLTHQLMIEEEKVVVNPFKEFIRIAGIIDLMGFDNKIPYNRLEIIMNCVNKYVPILKKHKIIGIDSGFRPCTPDEIPIIGPLPNHPRLLIAVGHCRFGLTFSALTAKFIYEYIEKHIQIPRILQPTRFKNIFR